MVLPNEHPRQIALIITAHSPPSPEWLNAAVKAGEGSAEVEGIRLVVVGAEGDSFSGWTLQQVSNHVGDNYSRPKVPFACRAFAIVDDNSERTNSVLVVSLDQKGLGETRIAGTVRVGPEYAVDIPTLLHGGITGILHYSDVADVAEDGILRREPPTHLNDEGSVWFTRILGPGEQGTEAHV